jgi:CO/xanthine dehydrogenase FAD-binding subunit
MTPPKSTAEHEYLFPAAPEEAVAMLIARAGHARVIAGGTDVFLDIEKGKLQGRAPDCLVDITRIPELGTIEVGDQCVTVGAAVPFVALREHPYLASHVHALVDAAASVGALAIQTAATWAGNLVQAMPAADGAIIATALDAEVSVLDAAGQRWLPVAQLFAGPGSSRIDSTCQLVTHIRFPIPSSPQGARWGTAWRRAGRRPSLVLPTLNCAAKIVLKGGVLQDVPWHGAPCDGAASHGVIASAAIAMGPVGPCPVRAHDAEAFLRGRAPSVETIARAARLVLCDADPRSSMLRASREYRLAVLPVLVEEALTSAVRRARGVAG